MLTLPGFQPSKQAAPPALPLPFAPAALSIVGGAAAALPLPGDSAAENALIVEPFFDPRQQLRLLARFPARSQPVVNGEPALRLALLAPGDQFQWEADEFRVALYLRPRLGPPPEAMLGKLCPVCRVPFAPAAHCFQCACGGCFHCQGPEQELDCVSTLTECLRCHRRIILTPHYEGEP